MAFTPTSPLTGATVTGLTSPTYTHAQASAPVPEAKQFNVSALGGTQTGVTAHSVSSPFTFTAWRPRLLKTLAFFNTLTGFKGKVGTNEYRLLIRKGMLPIAGAPPEIGSIDIMIKVPTGSEINDVPNLAALYSAAGGLLMNAANGMLDTAKTGDL